MGESQNRLKIYIKQGAKPLWLLAVYVFRIHKSWRLYINYKMYQNLGYLNPKTDPGNSIPTKILLIDGEDKIIFKEMHNILNLKLWKNNLALQIFTRGNYLGKISMGIIKEFNSSL